MYVVFREKDFSVDDEIKGNNNNIFEKKIHCKKTT